MRFAYLATIATLVVGTTAANPNPNLCSNDEAKMFANITRNQHEAYKAGMLYLQAYPKSKAAKPAFVNVSFQIPHLLQLCKEIKSMF
ncbi:hypothetical protein IWQ61_010719, partial [Dispira simplex]